MRKPFCEKIRNFNLFRAEIKKELYLRYWTYADLSTYTGYSISYITSMMSGIYGSRKAAFWILKKLNIDPKPFR